MLSNIQTLRIREADSDPYSLNKKTEYTFFDKSIKTRVLAAHTNQSKANQEPSKKMVKKILCRQIEKKNNYVVSKNAKFNVILYL